MADAPSRTKPNNCFSSHQFEEKKADTKGQTLTAD